MIRSPKIVRDYSGYSVYLDSPLGYEPNGWFETRQEAEEHAERFAEIYWTGREISVEAEEEA